MIIAGIAGLGSLAGYWTRIAKKYEDRRDQISLTELPAIYADTCAISKALDRFKTDASTESLASSLDKLSQNLEKAIFSGNILVFREQLFEPLYDFYQHLMVLQAVSEEISKDADNATQEQKLRSAFEKNEAFAWGRFGTNPKEILEKNSEMNKVLQRELRSYRSFSWKISLVIFAIGVFVALLEIIKTYFSA